MQALVACLGGLADADLAVPLTCVSALVASPPGRQFAAQFIEAGGASPGAMRRCVPTCAQHAGLHRLCPCRWEMGTRAPVPCGQSLCTPGVPCRGCLLA